MKTINEASRSIPTRKMNQANQANMSVDLHLVLLGWINLLNLKEEESRRNMVHTSEEMAKIP
jgi:hypothetical protein